MPWLELERIGLHAAQPDLRAGHVGEDGEGDAKVVLGLAHDPERALVVLGRPVAEVETEDGGAGLDQPPDHLRRRAGGPEGAEELRLGGGHGASSLLGTGAPASAPASATNAAGSSGESVSSAPAISAK